MDIRMPGMDGIEATRLITAGPATPRVLVLTTFDDDDYVYGALRAGASGFLVKDMALDDILARDPGGRRRRRPDRAERHPPADRGVRRPARAGAGTGRPIDGITDREREVLTLVGRGLSNTEIAAELFISVATVKTHVSRLLTKLDARDRVQLVIIAYETGLVTLTGPV